MGRKEEKVRRLNVNDASTDHLHLFAWSRTPFFYISKIIIYSIQVATSPTSLHHPPLTVTTSVTTTINETTTTTVTIINATTNTTLDSVTRPPPSPTSTGRSPRQQSQQQQLEGTRDALHLEPQVCLFSFYYHYYY